MIPQLDSFVIVRPDQYTGFNAESTQAVLQADQRVLGVLEKIIAQGDEQLRTKTGFSNDNMPAYSPTTTKYTLDEIQFEVTSTVKRINPEYQKAFDQLESFLEFCLTDWQEGVRKYRVRSYNTGSNKEPKKEPFIRLDYLMSNAYQFLANVTELKVEQKVECWAPPEYDDLSSRLIVPTKLLATDNGKYNISEPGAAKLWYQAKKFAKEVKENTIAPFTEEVRDRAEVSETKNETREHFEAIAGKYLIRVQSVPSPRRLAGVAMNTLFAIPEPKREEGGHPIITSRANYQTQLHDAQATLRDKKGNLKGLSKMGELPLIFYGLEQDPKVQEAEIDLSMYQAKRETNNGQNHIFVSLPAVYKRLGELENENIRDRMLHNLSILHLA